MRTLLLVVGLATSAHANRAVMEQIAAGANTIFIDTINVRVGVSTTTPATTLDVAGTSQFGTTAKSTFSTTGALTLASKVALATTGKITGADAVITYGVVAATGVFTSTLTVQGNAFSVGASTLVVSGGQVGIGVAPLSSDRLSVYRAASNTISRGNSLAYFGDNSLDAGLGFQQMLSSPYSFSLQAGDSLFASASHTFPLILNPDGGNVGVGTTNPGTPLEVVSANVNMLGGSGGVSAVYSNNSEAADLGGSIAFGGAYTGTTRTYWAGISGRKTNSTDANLSGYLQFVVRNNASGFSEPMRITDTSNVGIGTTNPATKIHMSSGTLTVDGTAAAVTVTGGSVTASAFFGDGSHLGGLSGAVQNSTITVNLQGQTATNTGVRYSVAATTVTLTLAGGFPVVVCFSGSITESGTGPEAGWSFIVDSVYVDGLTSSIGAHGTTNISNGGTADVSSCYPIKSGVLSAASHTFALMPTGGVGNVWTMGNITVNKFWVYESH